MSSITTRSKTQHQIQIWSQSLNECGIFNVVETKHDGDCLFSSILDFTTQNARAMKNPPQSTNQIRIQTIEYVLSRNASGFQENWDRFLPSIRYNLEKRIPGLTKYGESVRNDEIVRRAYRKYMSKSGNFGTFSELCAAAELYGFSGYIFQHDESNDYVCYDFGFTGNRLVDEKKPKVILLFTGPIDSGHFRRLQPSIAPVIIQPGKYAVSNDIPSPSANNILIKRIENNSINALLNTLSSQSTTPTQKDFQCDKCKRYFDSKRGLTTHRNSCLKNHQQEIVCTNTPEDTTDPNDPSLANHTCTICSQSFTKQGLTTHMNRHTKQANDLTANRLKSRLKTTDSIEPIPNNNNETKARRAALESECQSWNDVFENHLNEETIDTASFDDNVIKFQKFLFKANQRLPGPQHPSVKFYRLRQQNKNRRITSAQQSRSSNPQRTDARSKQRRRDKFQYDLAQYWYYNQRKKSVRMVMNEGAAKQCKIKMDVLENHFKGTFEQQNNKCLETYPNKEPNSDITLNEEDIALQIKRIALDTSAGSDRILVKTLRQLNIAKSISSIGNIMLRSSFVPTGFRQGKMILSDKDGDINSVSNWRPLTIYSVLRRIIEKALDSKLRSQITINCNQRGFVTGIPGCHVNARLINACLSNAKKRKRNCVIAFLDMIKAFDKIGHLHISKALKSKGVSNNLHDLIMNLLSNNSVLIALGKESSRPIEIKCGVPQGGPLSPILFNIAIDFIYEEICDSQYASNNGYKLSDEYDPLCLSGFADDQAISSDSENSACRTIDLVTSLFAKIGLALNASKSQAIIIKNGKLEAGSLHLADGSEIIGIQPHERIKYLGCSFESELIFDDTCIGKLNKNLNQLSISPLLKPDQKLNVINQYVFPILVYPLQAAPINRIPTFVTNGLDVMIRRTVKEILGLPTRTNDNLFYAPKKLRGLGLFRAAWEVHLQHFSLASNLSKINDGLFHSVSDCQEEMNQCIQALNVVGDSSRSLRAALRNESFENWCKLNYQGSGAVHFKNHTPSNDFIYNKNSLSSSEWVSAIKLNTNYANLNGVPGVASSSNLCRKCNRESETIPHVIGSCPSNNLLITSRHHGIKHQITNLLSEKSFTCFEEVYAIDSDGRSRFSDIIAFQPNSTKAYIIDPTIRYETNDIDQDEKIKAEKESIYRKCIPFYSEKYMQSFGERDWCVRGLWFGSRGTFGNSVIEFFREVKLHDSVLKQLSEQILSKTIHIINNHIYGS